MFFTFKFCKGFSSSSSCIITEVKYELKKIYFEPYKKKYQFIFLYNYLHIGEFKKNK